VSACAHRDAGKLMREALFDGFRATRPALLHPPLEGEGRLALSAARCETGWGDLSTRTPFEARDCHPTPPLISFASTLPLQGRVKKRRDRPRNSDSIFIQQQPRFRDLAECFFARYSFISRPLRIEGARNAGRPMRPRSRVQDVIESAHEHTGHTGITRHSPRNGFTDYTVLSPVLGLFGHRHP
jgi:hypothetical protein